MKNNHTYLNWLRIILTSIVIIIADIIAVSFVVNVYAIILGFEARGEPDSQAIQLFADRLGSVMGPLLGAVLTFWQSSRLTRKLSQTKSTHGTLVGFIIALFGLIVGNFSLQAFFFSFLILTAGFMGGKSAAKKLLAKNKLK